MLEVIVGFLCDMIAISRFLCFIEGALYEYVVMVMAGLAGSNAHLVSCTELALTKIIFDFKGIVKYIIKIDIKID